MNWKWTTLLLCTYGCIKELRPSEPYLYKYQHDYLNYTDEQLNGEVYPIWTYSFMMTIVPVLLFSDALLYKPVLIIESLAFIGTWLFLLFGRSLLTQQLAEVCYGLATSTEMAYFAFVYVLVGKEHYKRVTIMTRASLQAGEFIGYMSSEPILLFGWGDIRTLNFISLTTLSISFVFSCLLPNLSWRTVLQMENGLNESDQIKTYWQFFRIRVSKIKKRSLQSYSNAATMKWSLWWAAATCGEFFMLNYSQALWSQVQSTDSRDLLNGFVTAIVPLISMLSIFGLGKLPVDFVKYGEATLALAAIVQTALLCTMSQTTALLVMYITYGSFQVVYQCMITIAQINLVQNLVNVPNCGFVFGANTFLALLIQSAMTLVFVDDRVLGLPVRSQFLVYAAYHLLLGLTFSCSLLCARCARARK